MFTVDPAIGLPALAGIVWILRLEGKVREHTQLFEEREKQADERHQDLKSDIAELKRIIIRRAR